MIKKINLTWLTRVNRLGLSYRVIITLILLSLVATITEIFGIGIFLPIFQFIRLEGDLNALVGSSPIWRYVIDAFSFLDINPSLVSLLLISFAFFLFRQIFTYIRIVYNTAATQRLIQILRNRIFDKYIKANSDYYDSVPVGNLVNIITTEVSAAITGIMAPIELCVYIVMLTGYLTVLFILSWQITLVSIIVLILASQIPNVWIKKSAQTGRKLVDANTLMSEFLVGRLRSPRLVRLMSAGELEKTEFNRLTQVQRKHSVFGSILQARTEVVMDPIIIGLSLLFLYFSYTFFKLQVEVIGLYLVIILRLIPIAKGIISQWQSVQRYLGSIEAIENRIKDMQKSEEKDNGNKVISDFKQSIVLDNVSFRYPYSKDFTLKGINVEFEKNKLIALVGPSGSGKSTLIDMLPLLRIPTEGSVIVDGINIKNFNLKSLRKIISYAPQFPQIFNGTIKNHILYGKKDISDDELERAVQLAGADGFINRLPHKYETIVGEDAVDLSGGQRQRLDLARALVSKSPILILDEPTSNLDTESEFKFNKSLKLILKETDTTVIIITHHLKSIIDASHIIVLVDGKVEDSGRHSNLIKQNGWYAKAWHTQQTDF